jgi:hypothetical protein
MRSGFFVLRMSLSEIVAQHRSRPRPNPSVTLRLISGFFIAAETCASS